MNRRLFSTAPSDLVFRKVTLYTQTSKRVAWRRDELIRDLVHCKSESSSYSRWRAINVWSIVLAMNDGSLGLLRRINEPSRTYVMHWARVTGIWYAYDTVTLATTCPWPILSWKAPLYAPSVLLENCDLLHTSWRKALISKVMDKLVPMALGLKFYLTTF